MTKGTGADALRQDILSETYEDCKLLIYKIVHTFHRNVGGKFGHFDLDELIAEANLLFIQAFDKYSARLGSFTNWVYYYISMNLRERHRTFCQRKSREQRVLQQWRCASRNPTEPFNLERFMCHLSDDAELVVRLSFDWPPEVKLSLAERGSQQPRAIKAAVKEYLRDLGWSLSRIHRAFAEVASQK